MDDVCNEAALKLEEDARKVGEVTNDAERAINLSIAISLKRIADVICRPPPVVADLTPEQLDQMKEDFNKGGYVSFKS